MIDLELINDNNLNAPELLKFQIWLNKVSDKLQIEGEVCIKIVDQNESQSLNSLYRNKSKPTNVLSFPFEVPEYVETSHLGDLVICTDVVNQEANDQGKPPEHHWAHMCIHGLLHLLGYDHIESAAAEEMEQLEIELLAELGIANPY